MVFLQHVKATVSHIANLQSILSISLHRWVLSCIAFLLLSSAGFAQSITSSNCAAVEDEFWVISSRHLSADVCCLSQPENLRVWRCDSCGHLTPSRLEELWQPSPTAIDVVYVHGNRMEPTDVIERGLALHHRIRQRNRAGSAVRWIMWSWPSEKEGVLLTDVRTKADRADAQAEYLAWTLRRLDTQGRELRIIGYSFGSRVVSGALHVYAGGRVGGEVLEHVPPVQGQSIRVGLVAPALHADWLGPGRFHGLAGQNMECLHVFINSIDPVLAYYWLLDPNVKAPAMGMRGVTCKPRNALGETVPTRVHNCSDSVGRHHDEIRYYDSRCRANSVLATLIWGSGETTVQH